ncbi:alcohol dehydrogenase [Natranaerovirga pectinivora]|uniref:Alcohol dehydrogenase n=1 Tax=Natranaerovirga pectinivora TaxID=682400 RepID=A0A4R3MQ57_9FIRM|nr:iron-containing alcohol dehydrogenase [Natranaerovirga pectinivora]TCT17002.1 alcohol dehydrogenase [Natranaerovirga pectinivora]
MKSFNFQVPTEVIFGVDTIEQIGEIGNRYGKKAMIVTGGTSAKKSGLIDRVVTLLNKNNIDVVVFDEVTPNPLAKTVRDGVSIVKKENCDFIIGLGGGSAMDASKAIAFSSFSDADILDFFPKGKFAEEGPKGSLPLIAVTTTAGTGSEANKIAVITDQDSNRKCGLKTPYAYPTVAIIDPKLTLSVPPEVTAATGLDVFYHALEAFVSRKASVFTEMCSIEAMKLVVKSLETAVKEGSNLEAREDMAWANTLAGIAIDLAGTVAIHGTSHPISAYFNSQHGKALSAVAPTFLKYHYQADISKFAKIAEILGCTDANLTDEEKAAKSSEYLIKLLESVGMRITLTDLGVTEDMVETLTNNSFETMTGAIGNTPGKIEYEDMYRLYKESL